MRADLDAAPRRALEAVEEAVVLDYVADAAGSKVPRPTVSCSETPAVSSATFPRLASATPHVADVRGEVEQRLPERLLALLKRLLAPDPSRCH